MSGGRLYSRRLTAPSGLRVDGAAGLTPWAPRVLPVIGCALQASSGLAPSGVIKHRCAGEVRRHFISRFAAVFRRQAVYHGARQGAHIASAAMLYNSRGREPSTRLSGEADHRQNPASPGRQPGGWLNPRPRKRASTFGNTGKHRSVT